MIENTFSNTQWVSVWVRKINMGSDEDQQGKHKTFFVCSPLLFYTWFYGQFNLK